jgi:hypothetical protein
MRIPSSTSVLSAAVAAAGVLLAWLPASAPAGSAATARHAQLPARLSPAPLRLPPAGNPDGHARVPLAARAASTASPTTVIGTGTPAGCTSAAVVQAVARGGVITFRCGSKPVTITMRATAKVVNTSPRVVIDGGGKVTLSGGGKLRILYLNTCDVHQIWITWHCYNQQTPQLTVQNLRFIDGSAQGHDMVSGSGGAIYAQGGQLKVVNSWFISNRCYAQGPDLGGAAIRAYQQWSARPVSIVNSTFTGGACSNGGALSSIGVSWVVLDSLFTGNKATGWGANPAQKGTPGGGSGGAIYTDGDDYSLTLNGSTFVGNDAREGGGAVFYVSDNRTGRLRVENSTMRDNPSGVFHNLPGTMFYLGDGAALVTHSKLGS